jgi:hypothetical protein
MPWDHHAVAWRDEILEMTEKKTKILHFVDLTHSQRVVAAQYLAKKPLRGISVISNKASIPDGTFTGRNHYYFYITRYVIERISWICRDYTRLGDGNGKVKIIFSRRGKMSYEDFKTYLCRLKDNEETSIYWPSIDIEGIEARDHSTRAGLQIADVIASAMSCGIDPDHYGNCECRYAEILRPVIYRRKKNYMSYGAKIVPHPDGLELSADQKKFVALFR